LVVAKVGHYCSNIAALGEEKSELLAVLSSISAILESQYAYAVWGYVNFLIKIIKIFVRLLSLRLIPCIVSVLQLCTGKKPEDNEYVVSKTGTISKRSAYFALSGSVRME
jgi:hypothetical protein